jgi:hypothetical protein
MAVILPSDYFDNYADDDSDDRTYGSNWREYGFHRMEDYFHELDRRYLAHPRTCLEIGSADGSVIRELRSRGIETRGIEASGIYHQAGLERTRIAHSDAVQVVKVIPDNSYECVYETAAQYIEKKFLKGYFRNLRRIVKRDLVIVLHTHEDDPKPHRYQVNHEPSRFWIDLIEDAGFENRVLDTTPFWFTKEL